MSNAMPTSALDLILDEFVDRLADSVVRRLEAGNLPSHTELLSVPEAAAVLRCKPQRIYDLRSAGRLPRTVEGGRAVVRRADLERLVA
jgi:predicted DNA-binding transcriptional regulator AlpA